LRKKNRVNFTNWSNPTS